MTEVIQPYLMVLELQCQPGLMHDTVIPLPGTSRSVAADVSVQKWWQRAELQCLGTPQWGSFAVPTWFLVFSISARILWISRLSSEISPFVLRRSSPCFPAVACSSSYWGSEGRGNIQRCPGGLNNLTQGQQYFFPEIHLQVCSPWFGTKPPPQPGCGWQCPHTVL